MAKPAPQQSLTIGQVRITYLPDGYVIFNPALVFPTSNSAEWQRHQYLLNENGLLVGSIGSYLIQTPDRTILVDTAQGPGHKQNSIMTLHGGELLASLRQAGLDPTDIDIVFYTHLHIDHVGWTGRIIDGESTMTFPRARHLLRQAEWRRFADPAVSRRDVEQALNLLESCVEFAEDGQSFHSIIHFEYPDWTDIFDSDTELARATRLRLIEELTKPATYAAAAHFADTVFGHLTVQQGKVCWQPAQL
jgi:hypothetical protein